MAYSKSAAAAALGISKKEFEKRAKEAGFDNTESYWESIGGDNAPLVQSIQKEIIALDRQIDEMSPYLSLTDEEKEAFLQKAIAEVTPYYESKKAEIEAALKEGKVRTAEDILTTFREVEQETQNLLSKYDLTTAETEEEFADRLANLTATTEEELAMKKVDFRQRMENMKFAQIQQGTLTSGIGAKKRAEEQDIQSMEEQALLRRSEAQKIELERGKKYDLEQIQLARQSAEQARIRVLGTPEEAAAVQGAALGTLGYTSMGELPGAVGTQVQRTERGISPSYDKYALTDLQRERIQAQEATSQELQMDELARRQQEYEATVRKIQAERASKASKLSTLGA